MLTFFRRIRKRLLTTGAARKYLLYAIGEILLVMIGILLALQVNNWNEWKKDRKREKVLLLQLHDEFVTNRAELRKVVIGNLEILKALRNVISLFPIDPKTANRDSLQKYCTSHMLSGVYTFNSSNAIINAFTSDNSFDLITDNVLKYKVLRWYGVLEDFLEDENKVVKHVLEQLHPHFDSKGYFEENGLLGDRVDVAFLSTLQFEGLVRRKHFMMTRIYDLENDPTSPDLETLENFIEEIIALTKPQ